MLADKSKKVRKDYVRRAIIDLIESYLVYEGHINITMSEQGKKDNQIRAVRFAHKVLKLTLPKLVEWYRKNKDHVRMYYNANLTEELNYEYGLVFWKDVVKGKEKLKREIEEEEG